MPLLYQQNINPFTKIGVWHILEDELFFSKKTSLSPSVVHHPHKRLQHLAGRFMLNHLFPEFPLTLILLAETKKPFLEDEAYHFSISHCGEYAAAIVSTHNRVGIDIEVPQKKILGICHKFLKEEEKIVIENLPINFEQGLTLAWSVKETVFKWYGKNGVDFKKHIDIRSIQCRKDTFFIECFFTKEKETTLSVNGIFLHNNSLTWVCSEAFKV
ncbi:MAG: 4'-phosphopantetheinyl transferase superfamily protein [Ferruginibacter sp.]